MFKVLYHLVLHYNLSSSTLVHWPRVLPAIWATSWPQSNHAIFSPSLCWCHEWAVSCVSLPGERWPAGEDCLLLLPFRSHLYLRVNFLCLSLYTLRAPSKKTQLVVITSLCVFLHWILKGSILLMSLPLNMVPCTWLLLNKYLLKTQMH